LACWLCGQLHTVIYVLGMLALTYAGHALKELLAAACLIVPRPRTDNEHTQTAAVLLLAVQLVLWRTLSLLRQQQQR
jgi:uncharacterized membrane protein YqjE